MKNPADIRSCSMGRASRLRVKSEMRKHIPALPLEQEARLPREGLEGDCSPFLSIAFTYVLRGQNFFLLLSWGFTLAMVVFTNAATADQDADLQEFSLREAYELARESYPQLAIARLQVMEQKRIKTRLRVDFSASIVVWR